MTFEVGDKVRCLSAVGYDQKEGVIAEVVRIETHVGIQGNFNGHNFESSPVRGGDCWWINPDALELVESGPMMKKPLFSLEEIEGFTQPL